MLLMILSHQKIIIADTKDRGKGTDGRQASLQEYESFITDLQKNTDKYLEPQAMANLKKESAAYTKLKDAVWTWVNEKVGGEVDAGRLDPTHTTHQEWLDRIVQKELKDLGNPPDLDAMNKRAAGIYEQTKALEKQNAEELLKKNALKRASELPFEKPGQAILPDDLLLPKFPKEPKITTLPNIVIPDIDIAKLLPGNTSLAASALDNEGVSNVLQQLKDKAEQDKSPKGRALKGALESYDAVADEMAEFKKSIVEHADSKDGKEFKLSALSENDRKDYLALQERLEKARKSLEAQANAALPQLDDKYVSAAVKKLEEGKSGITITDDIIETKKLDSLIEKMLKPKSADLGIVQLLSDGGNDRGIMKPDIDIKRTDFRLAVDDALDQKLKKQIVKAIGDTGLDNFTKKHGEITQSQPTELLLAKHSPMEKRGPAVTEL